MRAFAAFALLAILLPAAVLAVLGYISLRQWEASAERVLKEQARDMASMAAEKIEMVLTRAEDDVLARLQATLIGPDAGPAALDRLQAALPLVQRLYLCDRDGRLVHPPSWRDEDARVVKGLAGEISQGFWERGGRRHFLVGDRVILTAVLRAAGGRPVLVAIWWNPEVLRREVLAPTLRNVERPTLLAVTDARGSVVYSPDPLDAAERLVTVAFGEALPSWRLALYQPPGASPEAAARRQIAIFTGAFGLLLLVIGVGLAATYRLVRRETEMARLKADFVANVSHDLKTPVSLIRMFGETLEMGRVRDEATRHEYYRVITRESERLSRLIDNVLDFSRIEGGRRRYDIVPTPVEPVVRETVDVFAYPLTEEKFTVEVAIAAGLPAVRMDADAVCQALANLVDNAIKYSAERKWLRVAAHIEDGRLALSVADAGVGIPREEQARIFDKFYRVGQSETQGRRGSGVGLALVRHVALAHGGRVTVESRPGEGSRFTLWLPLDGAR